jgi:hypothetical protein
MEYFFTSGGNNRPDFTYRFTMKEITTEMYQWCENYPLSGPFQRFHIVRNFGQPTDGDRKEIPLIQFEDKNAAFMFSIAYSEYILEDKTFSFAKDELWK